MDITCDQCKTVSSIPDAAIPDEGIQFECPHCSAQLFAKLGGNDSFDSLFEEPSLSLETDQDLDALDSITPLSDLSDDSLALDMKEVGADDISPSMLYNSEELNQQDQTVAGTPSATFKETPAPPTAPTEIPTEQPAVAPSNNLNSYLSSRSASVQEEKSQMSPLLILLMAVLIIGGAGGYYFFFMKNKNLNKQMVMTPEIQQIISSVKMDNPKDYKKALTKVSDQLALNPKHVLYKSVYVYIASKYFISIQAILPSFASDYKNYQKDIAQFATKSSFIRKSLLFANIAKVLSKQQDFNNKIKVDIQNLPPTDTDAVFLKALILYKNKNVKALSKLVDGTNEDPVNLIPVYMTLIRAQFDANLSLSLPYNKIKAVNPKHIQAHYFNIKYLINYNQTKEAWQQLSKMETMKNQMNEYELAQLYLLEAKVAEHKMEIKEAYELVKTAADLKLDNDRFFREILKFYYRNYYDSSALNMLKLNYKKKYAKDFEISKLYIKLLIRAEEFGKAGQISTDLRNKYPKKPEVYYISALLSDSLENTIMAIEFLEKALSINNEYEEAIVLLSKEYQRKGEIKKAKSLLIESVKNLKENTLVKKGLALLYYTTREFSKSLKLYKELASNKNPKIDQSDVNFRINMIEYLLKKQTRKETLRNLYFVYSKSPNFQELRLEIAKLEIQEKNYDKAIKIFKEELKIRENSIEANLYIGISYFYKKNYTDAERYLSKVISIDTKNHKAFFYLGKTYTEMSKLNKALDAYVNASSYDKNSYDYLQGVARTHTALNHASDAFEAYSKLVKLKPTFDALYEYGSLFLKQGDTRNALKYFNESYNINPKNKNLIFEMGNLFFKNQDYKKALKYYNKLLKLDKENPEAYYMIGEVYRSQDKNKKAIFYYNKAIKLNPNEGKYYYQLAYMYKSIRKYKLSLRTFKTYLKKVPDTPDKNEIMDEIYDLEHM